MNGGGWREGLMKGRRLWDFEGSREVDVRREEMGISVGWCRDVEEMTMMGMRWGLNEN